MKRYERTFLIGEKDLIRFHCERCYREKLLGMLAMAVAGALIVLLYSSQLPWRPSDLELGLMIAGGFVLALVFMVLGAWLVTSRQVRSSMKKQGITEYQQAVRVDGFGVRVQANGKEGKLGFEHLHMVRETGTDLYIYITPTQAWLLPKSQMADPEAECAQLREIFTTVVEPRRLKLRK